MDHTKEPMLLEKGAIEIQTELSRQIKLDHKPDISQIEKAAGVDLAYWKEGKEEYAVCCIVVLERETHRIIENQYSFGKVEVPYIPGCLAFRELLLFWKQLRNWTRNRTCTCLMAMGIYIPGIWG